MCKEETCPWRLYARSIGEADNIFTSSNTMETMKASASCIPDINKQQPNSLPPGSSRNSNNNLIIVLQLWSLISKWNLALTLSILEHFEERNVCLKFLFIGVIIFVVSSNMVVIFAVRPANEPSEPRLSTARTRLGEQEGARSRSRFGRAE